MRTLVYHDERDYICTVIKQYTLPYRVTAPQLAAQITRLWLADHWLALAAVPVVCLIAGAVFDLRFVFVALILIFLIMPGIVFTVYFYYGLSPECRFSLLPHRMIIDCTALTVDYISDDDDRQPRAPETIDWSQLTFIDTAPDKIIMQYGSSRYSLIIIPRTAFENDEDLLTAKKIIKNLAR